MAWVLACTNWCNQIKHLNEDVVWAEKPSRSTWLQATSTVLDEQKVVIPHLLFKGEYMPGRHGNRTSYGLMYRHGNEWRRVFMIEVYPKHVRSHLEKDGTSFFGPHLHLGDERLEQVTRGVIDRIGNPTAQRWVERFRRHTKIFDKGQNRLVGPMDGNLFSI